MTGNNMNNNIDSIDNNNNGKNNNKHGLACNAAVDSSLTCAALRCGCYVNSWACIVLAANIVSFYSFFFIILAMFSLSGLWP